jgi:hypothetical protein
MIDSTWRLAGVCEDRDKLQWNVRPAHAAAQGARFHLRFDKSHSAAMTYDEKGAVLHLNGRQIGRIESGAARLTTDKQGRAKRLTGIGDTVETVSLKMESRPVEHMTLRPNQQLQLG